MAKVVLVHGIGYTYQHREGMHSDWYEALRTGMVDTGLAPVEPSEVAAVYYGNCYRSAGTKSGLVSDELAAVPNYGPADLQDELELELLRAFAENVVPEEGGESAKGLAQGMLRRLERSRLLGDVPTKVVVWMVKQMRRYLAEERLRGCVQERVGGVVTPETRVIVGHSLGSVVAYEALCAHPEWQVDTLVTLGSPLGLGGIASRLRPPVAPEGKAEWPGVRRWVNIAALEDPVALVKELGTVFGAGVEDQPVRNGRFGMHSVLRYLTTAEAAQAVADALSCD